MSAANDLTARNARGVEPAGDVGVRMLDDRESESWTRFVASQADATLYQTLVWRDVIRDAFRHRPFYLIHAEGAETIGVLPLFEIRLPGLGAKLISIPYDVSSGGPLVTTERSEEPLARHAIELARERRARHLELRCSSPRPRLEALGFRVTEPVRISESILDEPASFWSRVRDDHKRSIDKASRRGVRVREARDAADFMSFYGVYLRVFRDFGTPPYGARYFEVLAARLLGSGSCRLLLAEIEGRCEGGLMLFCREGTWVSKFAVCLPDAVQRRAYAALYARALELAIEAGCRKLNWGSSAPSQTGLIRFKEGWAAETSSAFVYTLAFRGSAPSLDAYYDSEGLERRLWRKLPLSVTRLLGPPLNRWFC